MATASKLPVDSTATATQMAEAMFGSGITIVSSNYTGADAASGIYSDGDATAPGITPSDTGVILSTGNADAITNTSGDANTSAGTSTTHGTAGDADLSGISGGQTFDASVFSAEFIPTGSTLTMQVVFSSEEYLEYVDSGFNDAVGIWVNGEKAELMVGQGDMSIDNINNEDNSNLYVDNAATDDNFNTEMDGFTVTLTLKAPVNPDQVNTIKIGIADSGDGAFDSNLLIAGDSIQTALVAGDDELDVRVGDSQEINLLENDSSAESSTLTITEINGQPVVIGDVIELSTGEVIQLTDTGVTLISSDDEPGSNTFTYTVSDDMGNSDIGFVTVNNIAPCFTAGTRIAVPGGTRSVEALRAGDLVCTVDHGPQPLRWIGQTLRPMTGPNAPIEIAANTFGRHRKTRVSPNHRILLRSATAELLFGAAEVLVKAKDLVDGRRVRRVEGAAAVTYVHLLFDEHQIVKGDGLLSESYHPGPQTMQSFDEDTQAEVARLLPEVLAESAICQQPAARMSVSSKEATLLRSA